MKIVLIVSQFFILSTFYMAGLGIQKWLALPIPGSIIGMLLLFFALTTNVLPVRLIDMGSTFILKHMPLLFLPVTVGILQFLDLFSGNGILLIFITLISTIMVMVVSGLIGQKLVKRSEVQKE
ncbi:CidA/LrgA family protein [Alkalihalobacillus deserti]|uniref:CidA/LrgA family protein n=1 Tax=Alkalihalobacillus deserti TaxID=2879466 RepID=UPI001D15AB7F|nr:CidA/LrgA family protein [Alkalihalobacillus deserti]